MGLLTRSLINQMKTLAPPLVVEQVAWDDETWVYVRMLTAADAELAERVNIRINQRFTSALAARGLISTTDAARLEVVPMESYEAEEFLQDAPSARIPLLIQTVCDEQGHALFTEADAPFLNQQSPALIKRLYDVAWRLNAMGGEERVKAAEKNSESSQGNDSGTDLATNGVVLSVSSNNG